MLKINLVKRASKPAVGDITEHVERKVNLPARERSAESQNSPGSGGEKD